MKFLRTWETTTQREEAIQVKKGLVISGRELQAFSDNASITVDTVSGIQVNPSGLTDNFLAQITTANKVAGSAVQLQSIANGGLTNNSGLGLVINSDMFSFNATSGLTFDYDTSHFQFVPGTGLKLNAVPNSVLSSTVVFTDGTRPFTAPQGGVDAIASSDLTTLSQVQSLITGDYGETLINLAGQNIIRGQVGYVESTSGSFQLARANSPTTARVEYIVSDTTINDGASGIFRNPSVEIDNVTSLVSGIGLGNTLYLSTTEWGQFQATSPSVSGETIFPCGWKIKSNKLVFFPGSPIDL